MAVAASASAEDTYDNKYTGLYLPKILPTTPHVQNVPALLLDSVGGSRPICVTCVPRVKRIFSLEYGGRAAYVETHGMVLTPSVGISGRL